MRFVPHPRAWPWTLALVVSAGSVHAADGFKLRFPLTGTLGGEIVAPLPEEGTIITGSLTQIRVEGLTGNDGNPATVQNSTRFSLTPAQVAGLQATAATTQQAVALGLLNGRSATATGQLAVGVKYDQTQANMIVTRILSRNFAGGKLGVSVNIPYAWRRNTAVAFSGPTPTLSTLTPAVPAAAAGAVQGAAQSIFSSGYQQSLLASSSSASVDASGLGDVEASVLWEYSKDKLKTVSGVTLAMPTGKYTANSQSPNIGYGNYYTVRPGFGVAYQLTDEWTLGARGSLGFNTVNKDNNIRSGNYAVLDLAAAYKSSVAAFGPHVLILRQYTDDTGGSLGSNRTQATGAGLFAATKIPVWGVGVNFSYMKVVNSRNSLTGDFFQVRFTKLF
jgi:hypothetical protein